MSRRTKTPPRTAAELKRDAGRLHALRGAAMRDVAAMHELHERHEEKRAGRGRGRQKREGAGGIRMGE